MKEKSVTKEKRLEEDIAAARRIMKHERCRPQILIELCADEKHERYILALSLPGYREFYEIDSVIIPENQDPPEWIERWEKTLSEEVGKRLTCTRCRYTWMYRGRGTTWATCPRCHASVRVKDVKK
jgi:hypothetical protein